MKSEELTALRQSVFFGAVGQKAETADTLEAVGEHVKQEAADELFGIEGHRFQPVFVSLRAKSGLDPIIIIRDTNPGPVCVRDATD